MSVKCTRDKQNEDSSFSTAVCNPACPSATPTAPAPARAPRPGTRRAQACPAPATRAPDTLQAAAAAPQGPRPGRAAPGRGSEDETRGGNGF